MRVVTDEGRGLVEVHVEGDYDAAGLRQVYEAHDRLAATHQAFGEVHVVDGPGRGFEFRTVLQGAKDTRGTVRLKRLAVVTDTSRRAQSAGRFLSLFGVDSRTYASSELEEARAWAAKAAKRA